MQNNWLILIVGPTAVGKTNLSIKLAQHFNTEIISADSRQFYKEMEIGTAKPNSHELSLAKHHFINNISVTDYYSAGDFERDANKVLAQIFVNHKIAIAVGGSGLYTKALTHGLDNLPKVDFELRNKLINLFKTKGIIALQKKLEELNPEKLNHIDKNNSQRLMRAIELSVQNKNTNKQAIHKPYKTITIGLNIEREILYNLINQRVDFMVDAGLLHEVENLKEFKELTALQTVGYTELFKFFDGELTLAEAIEKIKQHSRNYAKKQITWFKKQENITWFEPNNYKLIVDFISQNTGC